MKTTKTDASYKVIRWNRMCLNCIGIWPLKVHDTIFIIAFIYLCIHCTMALVDVMDHSKDIDYIFTCLTENICFVMALVKITTCRLCRHRLADVLHDIESDFSMESYKTVEEKISFVSYNGFTLKFIVSSTIINIMAETLYYALGLTMNVMLVARNLSHDYRAPYRSRPIVLPHDDVNVFAMICAYQYIMVPVYVFGYIGVDSFFITLVLHICSQFSVLSCRVKNAMSELKIRPSGIKMVIQKHLHLIRIVNTIESSFNIVILLQLMGTMLQLCLTGYHGLMSTEDGQYTKLITFVLLAICLLSTLFLYCYAGECLIKETTNFGEELYHSEWYDISPRAFKLLHICMIRTGKPLYLTSGKFCILSMSMFADVVKSSMAYLSMIRTMLERGN